MPTCHILLREALAVLRQPIDQARDRSHTMLVTRIETFINEPPKPPHPAIALARARWRMVSFLRVDAEERCVDEVADGIWVRGWIKVGKAAGGDIPPDVAVRYERAVAALPHFTQRVFVAHHSEGLDYLALARRFAITLDEVEKQLADALVAIAQAVRDA